MLNKHHFLILLLSVLCIPAFSQGIASDGSGMILLYKNTNEVEDTRKRGYYIGPHELGDEITELLNQFEKAYVYYEQGTGAYAVEERKVEKMGLYAPVKKVLRHYEAQIKKGKIPRAEAEATLKEVLKKTVQMKRYNTTSVEKELQNKKKPEEIVEYIKSIQLSAQ